MLTRERLRVVQAKSTLVSENTTRDDGPCFYIHLQRERMRIIIQDLYIEREKQTKKDK